MGQPRAEEEEGLGDPPKPATRKSAGADLGPLPDSLDRRQERDVNQNRRQPQECTRGQQRERGGSTRLEAEAEWLQLGGGIRSDCEQRMNCRVIRRGDRERRLGIVRSLSNERLEGELRGTTVPDNTWTAAEPGGPSSPSFTEWSARVAEDFGR